MLMDWQTGIVAGIGIVVLAVVVRWFRRMFTGRHRGCCDGCNTPGCPHCPEADEACRKKRSGDFQNP